MAEFPAATDCHQFVRMRTSNVPQLEPRCGLSIGTPCHFASADPTRDVQTGRGSPREIDSVAPRQSIRDGPECRRSSRVYGMAFEDVFFFF